MTTATGIIPYHDLLINLSHLLDVDFTDPFAYRSAAMSTVADPLTSPPSRTEAFARKETVSLAR